MKSKIGLAIAILGILILLGNIYYTAKTQESNLFMIPIGLAVTFGGIFYMKSGQTE